MLVSAGRWLTKSITRNGFPKSGTTSLEDSLRMIEDALEVDSDNALLWVEAADLNLPQEPR